MPLPGGSRLVACVSTDPVVASGALRLSRPCRGKRMRPASAMSAPSTRSARRARRRRPIDARPTSGARRAGRRIGRGAPVREESAHSCRAAATIATGSAARRIARIIALQRAPQAGCLDAHDRIDLRIEARVAPQRLDADRITLEGCAAPAEGHVDDETQKGAELRRGCGAASFAKDTRASALRASDALWVSRDCGGSVKAIASVSPLETAIHGNIALLPRRPRHGRIAIGTATFL